MITTERLRELLDYDPLTGIFRWRVQRTNVMAGDIAGWIANGGYRYIRIDRRNYYAHRLAWFYVHGRWPSEIDHKNTVLGDNRFENLREITHAGNGHNKWKAQSNSTTGLRGVSPSNGKFRAQIKLNGKHQQLGLFATAEAAHAAYLSAKRRLHPEWAESAIAAVRTTEKP